MLSDEVLLSVPTRAHIVATMPGFQVAAAPVTRAAIILACIAVSEFAASQEQPAERAHLELGVELEEVESRQGNHRAYAGEPVRILVIDGIDEELLPVVHQAVYFIPGLSAEGRATSYLEAYVSHWQLSENSSVHYAPWSGAVMDGEEWVDDVRALIVLHQKLAERRDESFAIVSHSWGSVLAVRALAELQSQGELGTDAIDLLVTMGAPINNDVIEALVPGTSLTSGSIQDLAAETVDSWHNYYVPNDCISSERLNTVYIDKVFTYPLEETTVLSRRLRSLGTPGILDLRDAIRCVRAHSSYYTDPEKLGAIEARSLAALSGRESYDEIWLARRRAILSKDADGALTAEQCRAIRRSLHDAYREERRKSVRRYYGARLEVEASRRRQLTERFHARTDALFREYQAALDNVCVD